MTAEDLADQLEQILLEQEFDTRSAELTDKWVSEGIGLEAVEPTLRFMETHPNVDYGMPGALVHFLERFYQQGYEERLLESLRRQPTALTAWMLNRVINGTKEPELRQRLVAAMRAARSSPAADDNAKQAADRFLQRLA